MVYLCIDFGEKYVGLAISDIKEIVATPIKIIKRISDEQSIKEILDFALSSKVEKIVVGVPQKFSYLHQKQFDRIMSFVDKLKAKSSLEIITYDESFSSVESIGIRKRKKRIDDIAASIVLQKFLDNKRLNNNNCSQSL